MHACRSRLSSPHSPSPPQLQLRPRTRPCLHTHRAVETRMRQVSLRSSDAQNLDEIISPTRKPPSSVQLPHQHQTLSLHLRQLNPLLKTPTMANVTTRVFTTDTLTFCVFVILLLLLLVAIDLVTADLKSAETRQSRVSPTISYHALLSHRVTSELTMDFPSPQTDPSFDSDYDSD